jgi:hypothetical protein
MLKSVNHFAIFALHHIAHCNMSGDNEVLLLRYLFQDILNPPPGGFFLPG